jgi:hypothetical protein
MQALRRGYWTRSPVVISWFVRECEGRRSGVTAEVFKSMLLIYVVVRYKKGGNRVRYNPPNGEDTHPGRLPIISGTAAPDKAFPLLQ